MVGTWTQSWKASTLPQFSVRCSWETRDGNKQWQSKWHKLSWVAPGDGGRGIPVLGSWYRRDLGAGSFEREQKTKMEKGTVLWAESRHKSEQWTVRDPGDPSKSGFLSRRDRERGREARRQKRRRRRRGTGWRLGKHAWAIWQGLACRPETNLGCKQPAHTEELSRQGTWSHQLENNSLSIFKDNIQQVKLMNVGD